MGQCAVAPQGGDSLLFVDVDGVLNSKYTLSRNREEARGKDHHEPYDEPCEHLCRLVKLIVDETSTENHPTRCILSSTWRLQPKAFRRVRRSLMAVGVEIYARTPHFPFLTRVQEIEQYVRHYNNVSVLPARAWLAIDDMPLLKIAVQLKRTRNAGDLCLQEINFVQTRIENGLEKAQALKAIDKLRSQALQPKDH